MNTKKLIVLCLLLLTVHLFVFSQEKINPQLLDRFGEICSEDFMARYDNLLLEIQSNKDSKAHILFYGNETKEGKNLEFIKMEFKRKFGNRKRPDLKKGLFLIVLLAIVIFLWFNAEKFIDKIL